MNKQIKNALYVVGASVFAYIIYRNLVEKKNADGKVIRERVLVDLPVNF